MLEVCLARTGYRRSTRASKAISRATRDPRKPRGGFRQEAKQSAKGFGFGEAPEGRGEDVVNAGSSPRGGDVGFLITFLKLYSGVIVGQGATAKPGSGRTTGRGGSFAAITGRSGSGGKFSSGAVAKIVRIAATNMAQSIRVQQLLRQLRGLSYELPTGGKSGESSSPNPFKKKGWQKITKGKPTKNKTISGPALMLAPNEVNQRGELTTIKAELMVIGRDALAAASAGASTAKSTKKDQPTDEDPWGGLGV